MASRKKSKAPAASPSVDRIAERAADVNATAEAMPFNANKALEYGLDNAHAPQEGEGVEPPSEDVGASTLSEANASDKLGTRAASGDPVAWVRWIRCAPMPPRVA
jgi:catalase